MAGGCGRHSVGDVMSCSRKGSDSCRAPGQETILSMNAIPETLESFFIVITTQDYPRLPDTTWYYYCLINSILLNTTQYYCLIQFNTTQYYTILQLLLIQYSGYSILPNTTVRINSILHNTTIGLSILQNHNLLQLNTTFLNTASILPNTSSLLHQYYSDIVNTTSILHQYYI